MLAAAMAAHLFMVSFTINDVYMACCCCVVSRSSKIDWITLTRKTWIKKVLADIGARTKLDCQVN